MKGKTPPVLEGLNFSFLQKAENNIPSTCPAVKDINTGKIINKVIDKENPEKSQYPATDEYNMLGSFIAYKILRRGFEDDPRYDYVGYWNNRCTNDKAFSDITEDEIIEKFDEMQYKELGELNTGATTLLGFIGKKAVLDGRMDVAGKIFEKLASYADYVDSGKHNKSKLLQKSCSGKTRKENCDDTLSRAFLGIGMMTGAAIQSGNTFEQEPSKALVQRTINEKELGNRQTGKDFEKAPYKVGSETLYRCVIESKPGSLKRDQCMEGIKDMMVEGVIADNEKVYSDAIESLGSWYHDPLKEPKEWKDNVGQWVDSTIWMANGLIKILKREGDTGNKFNGTAKIIDEIAKQKKENIEEFSTADWITQQALIILAHDGKFNRHDEIIKIINEDRLSVWNPWLDVYLSTKALDACPENNPGCFGGAKSDINKALRQLGASIMKGCLLPIATDEKNNTFIPSYKKSSVDRCSTAISRMIEKAGNDETLYVLTEPYFWFGQDDGGYHYMENFKEIVQKGIDNRFTPSFVSKMKGSTRKAEERTEDATIEKYLTTIFKNRPFKFEGKTVTGNSNFLIGPKLKEKGEPEAIIYRLE